MSTRARTRVSEYHINIALSVTPTYNHQQKEQEQLPQLCHT